MAELRSVKIAPGWKGRDGRTFAANLPADKAADLKNFLPGTPGPIRARGPLIASDDQPSPTPNSKGAWVATDGRVLFWDGQTNTLARASQSGVTSTVSTFGVASSSFYPEGAAASVLNGIFGYTSSGQMMKWDGGTTVTRYTTDNSPHGPNQIDVIAHLERVFVLGGTVPGTASPGYWNRVYYSDAGGPTTDTLTYWQDDYSGLVNQIVLPLSVGRYIGMAHIGQNLAFLAQEGIYMLYGQTPATFSVRRANGGRGCLSKHTIVEYDDGVFYLGRGAFYWFDGVNTTVVSDDIADSVQNAAYTLNPDTSYASAALLDHETIFLTFIDELGARHSFTFHIPTRAWSRVSLAGDAYLTRRSSGWTFGWDGTRVWNLDRITSSGQVVNVGDEGRDRLATPTYPLQALEYETRIVTLERPESKVQLSRVHVDYWLAYEAASNDAGLPTNRASFDITVIDADTGTTLATHSAPAVYSSDTKRQRASFDCFGEAHNVQVRIELAGDASSSGLGFAEPPAIGDVTIEYQRSHRTL